MGREKVIKDLEEYRDREFVKEGTSFFDSNPRYRRLIIGNAITLLKEQPEIVRCKDCKWYDERVSLCDNCGLPREQTFFCADGKRADT